MGDKWRVGLEFTGLLVLAGSLVFVAMQMQQERKIALAQLNLGRRKESEYLLKQLYLLDNLK